MARSLSESTSSIKIALLFLAISFLIFLVGFSTPHWSVYPSGFGVGEVSLGLWQLCYEVHRRVSNCFSSYSGTGPNWFYVIRALECVGLVGFVLSLAGTIINVFLVRSKSLKQAVIFVIVMSGLAILAGCVYFVIKTDIKYLGYSYTLCCVGGSGAMFVGFLLCLDVRSEREPQPEPLVLYNPGQPTPTVLTLPAGPYPGRVLSLPPSAPQGQGFMGQAPAQYSTEGNLDQGYKTTPNP